MALLRCQMAETERRKEKLRLEELKHTGTAEPEKHKAVKSV